MRNESRIYEQFDEYMDISDHIRFAESLIDKYEWDKETKKSRFSASTYTQQGERPMLEFKRYW